jgi:hypothetical protein
MKIQVLTLQGKGKEGKEREREVTNWKEGK